MLRQLSEDSPPWKHKHERCRRTTLDLMSIAIDTYFEMTVDYIRCRVTIVELPYVSKNQPFPRLTSDLAEVAPRIQ